MHVAFVAPPLRGHLDPLRAVARELARRGHRATLVGRPELRALWHGDGLALEPVDGARPLADTVDALTRGGPLAFPSMLRELARGTGALCDALPARLRAIGADRVVADQAEPAGALVAAALGLPWITAASALPLDRDPDVPPPWRAWTPEPGDAGRRRNRVLWSVSDALMRPLDRVVEARARGFGLPARPSHAWASPVATITQLVPSLDFPRSAPPPGFEHLGPWRDADPADDVPDVPIDARRPLAFCSFGTLQGGRGALFARVARACEALGLALVVAHGGRLDAARAHALPGAPVVRDFVRQRAVLARSAVAIVHGGLNTALDAVSLGVPLVVVPLAFEQPGVAARLGHAGVAEVLPGPGARPARLRDAIARAIDGPARGRASSIAREMAGAGGAAAAADRIEALAGGARRAARGREGVTG